LSLEEQVMERERQGTEWRTQMKAVKVAQEGAGWWVVEQLLLVRVGGGAADDNEHQQHGKGSTAV